MLRLVLAEYYFDTWPSETRTRLVTINRKQSTTVQPVICDSNSCYMNFFRHLMSHQPTNTSLWFRSIFTFNTVYWKWCNILQQKMCLKFMQSKTMVFIVARTIIMSSKTVEKYVHPQYYCVQIFNVHFLWDIWKSRQAQVFQPFCDLIEVRALLGEHTFTCN